LLENSKKKNPNIIVVGVDPNGSILAQPEELNKAGIHSYKVEGIGYDFIPDVLDRSVVDKWYKSDDKESFVMARRLIKEEGLLCGGSSGTAMHWALEAAKELKEGQRCVVILPDSVRNYMSKFLNDNWMIENSFSEPEAIVDWWANKTVQDLSLSKPETIKHSNTIGDTIQLMKNKGFDQFPVLDDNNKLVGTVTEGNLTAMLLNKRVKIEDTVEKCLYRQFRTAKPSTKLSELSTIFNLNSFAIVVENEVVQGVATRIDLLNYISKTQ